MDVLTKQHAALMTEMTYLVLDAAVACKICCVELENHKLEDPPVCPHCLYCYGAIQYTLGLGLTHTQHNARGKHREKGYTSSQIYSETLLNVMCISLPHIACEHGQGRFQTWTWASWLWTALDGAYIEVFPPWSKVCGHEDKGSHLWNLIREIIIIKLHRWWKKLRPASGKPTLRLWILTCAIHVLLVHVYFLQVDGGGDRIEGFQDVICRFRHFLFPRNLRERIHAVMQ